MYTHQFHQRNKHDRMKLCPRKHKQRPAINLKVKNAYYNLILNPNPITRSAESQSSPTKKEDSAQA